MNYDYNLDKELDEIADQLRIIELEIKILNKLKNKIH